MDGKTSRVRTADKPIAKPGFPLPSIFSPSLLPELPTRRRGAPEKIERAHFFRKGTNEYGSPVYGFFITREKNRELPRD